MGGKPFKQEPSTTICMEDATFHDIPTNFISSQQENFRSSEVFSQLRASAVMNGESNGCT